MVDVKVEKTKEAYKLKFSWGQQDCRYYKPNGEVFSFIPKTLYKSYEEPTTKDEIHSNDGYKIILTMSNNTKFRIFDKVSI